MVNKEFIISGGSVIKDFEDRNIPQNSDKFVNVSVLIPTSEFVGKTLYSVELAVGKQLKGQFQAETLPSLICYSAKTLKINGVDYIKWQTQLTINYTNFIGTLFLSPYIIDMVKVIELDDQNNEVEKYEITKQSTSTTVQLNVIKAIQNTSDAFFDTQEGADVVSVLSGLINEKHIMTITEFAENDLTTAINGCFENYVSSYYAGWLLIVKYDGGVVALFPYQDNGDNAYTMIKMDGSMSKLYGYTSSPQATFNELQLTYTKGEMDTKLQDYYTKSETYSDDEVDALLDTKVDKTFELSGHALNGASLQLHPSDVELGNVANNTTINSPTENANSSWVSAGGLYAYLRANYYTSSELDSTISKVNELYALYKDATPDNDDVVNTLYDLVQVFSNFPESSNIASVFSGIESRLDTLESLDNVVVNVGAKTILTTDWESNSGDYSSDYPYKTKSSAIQSDLLKGATNFQVVFGVDADTSLLSTTAVLNNETGVITFYASEIPSEDIAIENIVAWTDMNAINTLTTQTINQVTQNKNDIADINDTKLPLYELKQESLGSGNGNKTLTITSGTYIQQVKYGSGATLKQARFRLNKDYAQMDFQSGESSQYLAHIKILKEANDDRAYIEMQTKDHILKLDSNGLTLDGNAVGGGGSQLYQHNISLEQQNIHCNLSIIITNDSNEAIDTLSKIASALYNLSKIADNSNQAIVSGIYEDSSKLYIPNRCYSSNGTSTTIHGFSITDNSYANSPLGTSIQITDSHIKDTIIAL